MSKPLFITPKNRPEPIVIGLTRGQGKEVIVRRLKERPEQVTVKIVNGHAIRFFPHGE